MMTPTTPWTCLLLGVIGGLAANGVLLLAFVAHALSQPRRVTPPAVRHD